MSKTRAQIQFKVVSILVGGDVGTPVSAEDADTINGYIDSEVAELSADGTTYIQDPDDLDDSIFNIFCKLVANAAADEFGGKSDENLGKTLRNRLKALVSQIPGYGPQQIEWF
jgi:hypothetical protein